MLLRAFERQQRSRFLTVLSFFPSTFPSLLPLCFHPKSICHSHEKPPKLHKTITRWFFPLKKEDVEEGKVGEKFFGKSCFLSFFLSFLPFPTDVFLPFVFVYWRKSLFEDRERERKSRRYRTQNVFFIRWCLPAAPASSSSSFSSSSLLGGICYKFHFFFFTCNIQEQKPIGNLFGAFKNVNSGRKKISVYCTFSPLVCGLVVHIHSHGSSYTLS